MLIINHVLTIDGTTIDLPRLPVASTLHVWTVPTEYQTTGYFVSAQASGQPMEIPACDGRDAVYQGALELEADAGAVLAAAVAAKIAEAAAACDAVLNPLGTEYGAWEKQTWDQQATEAALLLSDPTLEPTPAIGAADKIPCIRAMATARGCGVVELAQRILVNRENWLAISGAVIGQRQKYYDQIKAAAEREGAAAADVSAINIVITLPVA